jgi:MFS family permease
MLTSRRATADAARVYYWLTAGETFFFCLITTVNMVYQFQVAGLSPLQLVLVGTLLETVAFLCEVPTGIVADVYSRRLSIVIGYVLVGAGFAIEGLVPEFAVIMATQVIWGIGITFTSGATVVAKVSTGVTTSAPAGSASSSVARYSALEPEFTITPWRLANSSAMRDSNVRTRVPIWVDVRRTSTTAAISSSPWTVCP